MSYLRDTDRFRYTTQLPEPGRFPLVDFLLRDHAGDCQHFAIPGGRSDHPVSDLDGAGIAAPGAPAQRARGEELARAGSGVRAARAAFGLVAAAGRAAVVCTRLLGRHALEQGVTDETLEQANAAYARGDHRVTRELARRIVSEQRDPEQVTRARQLLAYTEPDLFLAVVGALGLGLVAWLVYNYVL